MFIWDGTKLLQEYTYKGAYTYVYTDQDSYEPLAHVFHNNKDAQLYLSYYHTDQIGIPREQTDQYGNVLWLGDYTAWGSLKTEQKIYPNAHQPFRLQNQYCDQETGLHYNLFRYYEPNCGRFINQDPIKLFGGEHLYIFAPNSLMWIDPLGLVNEFEIAPYTDKRHQKDKLSAHELLQNAWLKNNGHANSSKTGKPSRNSGLAKCNPAMGLYEDDIHSEISDLQRKRGLFNPNVLKKQTVLENIELNANMTRYGIYKGLLSRGWEKSSARVYAIQMSVKLKSEAINFARSNKLLQG